jgi:uncharacterized protein (DUF2252 family)
MNIVESTRQYDRWLEQRLPAIVKRDLEVKHQRMAQDPFSFLRATFYRWAQDWAASGANASRLWLIGVAG